MRGFLKDFFGYLRNSYEEKELSEFADLGACWPFYDIYFGLKEQNKKAQQQNNANLIKSYREIDPKRDDESLDEYFYRKIKWIPRRNFELILKYSKNKKMRSIVYRVMRDSVFNGGRRDSLVLNEINFVINTAVKIKDYAIVCAREALDEDV